MIKNFTGNFIERLHIHVYECKTTKWTQGRKVELYQVP